MLLIVLFYYILFICDYHSISVHNYTAQAVELMKRASEPIVRMTSVVRTALSAAATVRN